MIWQNPWAWLGLGALALPILIHLLGRGRAKRERFPSLRFLPASRMLPTRRTRIHDPLLLLVRMAALAFAVAALAQPLWLTARREQSRNETIARVVIVDTSTSMRRLATGGVPAVDAARRLAKALVDSAGPGLLVETAEAGRALVGATAWLERQPARGSIAVISDFQLGAVNREDVAAVPLAIGLQLDRIAVASDTPIEVRARAASGEIRSRTVLSSANTTASWTRGAADSRAPDVELLTGLLDSQSADAALRAAHTLGAPLAIDSAHRVAIVYPGFPERARLQQRIKAPAVRWMIDLISALRTDSLLSAAAADAMVATDTSRGALLIAVRNTIGAPVVLAGRDSSAAGERLVLFANAPPGSIVSAALIAAAERAISVAPRLAELEPGTLSDSLLGAWRREPAVNVPRAQRAGGTGESDGRWLWAVVLVMLAIETVLRRRQTPAVDASIVEVAHERVA